MSVKDEPIKVGDYVTIKNYFYKVIDIKNITKSWLRILYVKTILTKSGTFPKKESGTRTYYDNFAKKVTLKDILEYKEKDNQKWDNLYKIVNGESESIDNNSSTNAGNALDKYLNELTPPILKDRSK